MNNEVAGTSVALTGAGSNGEIARLHSERGSNSTMVFAQRRPGESKKAFAAFSLDLSLGPERSTHEVEKQLGKREGLMERWAAKIDWRSRGAAHGAHLAIRCTLRV